MDSDDHTTSKGIACRRSRRTVLSLGAASVVSALAGCSSLTGQSASGSDSSDSVFTDISFEGQQMVVELAENHDVERVNLIGPDGSQFSSSTVAAGATKVSIQILRVSSGNFYHYPVGESKLVTVGQESNQETAIKLNPSLTIDGASQYDGDENRDYGNISFTVKNTGSAPTWIYRIFYKGVPNREAKDKTANKGEPTLVLKKPSTDEGAILGPGESEKVVGHNPPLLFSEKPQCKGSSVKGTVFIDTPVKPPAKSRFKATLSGNRQTVGTSGFTERYTCDDVSIELAQEATTDG